MEYSKCPSCEHEIYDRSAGKCPFCGHALPKRGAAGSQYSAASGRKVRLIILIAILLFMLIAGLTTYLAAASSEGSGKEGGRTTLLRGAPRDLQSAVTG